MAGDTHGPLTEELSDQLTRNLNDIVYSGQIIGVTHQQLAERFGVSRQTISARLKRIFSAVPKEDIEEVYCEFRTLFDRLFRECNNLLREANTPELKEKAIRLTLLAIKEKTELLERFHLKPRAVDNIAIKADISVVHRMEKLRDIYNETRTI